MHRPLMRAAALQGGAEPMLQCKVELSRSPSGKRLAHWTRDAKSNQQVDEHQICCGWLGGSLFSWLAALIFN